MESAVVQDGLFLKLFLLGCCTLSGIPQLQLQSLAIRKMIVSNQQIALHLATLRNLTSYNSGRYALRLSLASRSKPTNKATPVCVIQKHPLDLQNRSDFDEQYFFTKSFSLKSAMNVDIGEIYVFKFDSQQTSNKEEQQLLSLTVQLVQIEIVKQKVVAVCNSVISPNALHEYLEIDFYEGAPCQIAGSYHRCYYRLELKADDMVLDLRTFCERYYKDRADQVLTYLQNEGQKNYRSLAEYSSMILKQEVEIDCIEMQESIKHKIFDVQTEAWEGQTEVGQGEDGLSFDYRVGAKKRRKRIFSITKDSRLQKYQNYEKKIHQNAQKIYGLWRDLLPNLFRAEASLFLAAKAEEYHKKLIQKTKESVCSFKGCWDTDMYGEETALREQLANQLRNQNNQFNQDLRPSIHNQFPILNQALFTSKRPIFFEQKSAKTSHTEEPLVQEILVILVHGLGACRMDMQKNKIELKRYYEGKIKVFSSSTNQGRTEGEIESMGIRLASEIDYQLSRFTQIPKICIIGHSMGGLIARSALPRLQKYKRYFHSFITLSSPHLGYAYSSSKLIDAGLWFMSAVKKCTSLIEMTMNDKQKGEQTFLYRLSQKTGLDWFKKIVFLGSHQDHYVPYYSARVQKHDQSLADQRSNVEKGKIHCEMVNNILHNGKASITRLDVHFSITEQNIDNFIGRAAHINFINNPELLRTLVLAGKHYFF